MNIYDDFFCINFLFIEIIFGKVIKYNNEYQDYAKPFSLRKKLNNTLFNTYKESNFFLDILQKKIFRSK